MNGRDTAEMGGRNEREGVRRRRVLAIAGAFGVAGTAGCLGILEDETDPDPGLIGSGREGRDAPGGTPMDELPELSGELTVYSGRNEFLVGAIVDHLEATYDDLVLEVRYGGANDLVNTIDQEGSGTPADVFFSVNAGALGTLSELGRARSLSETVLDTVREEFHTDEWVGTSGRARSVPYNTDAYSEDEIPSDIMEFTDFDGDLGWAPGYGSCQAFLTAMRLLEDEDATRNWIESVLDAGIRPYNSEDIAVQGIADGEIDAAFTNHYYIQRLLDDEPDAPVATTFTEGDAGAIFNVAGAAVVDETDNPDLAENFIRHLLSAEAQEFFAVENYEYPLIPRVEPVGDLPTIDDLDVPDLDLTELADLEPTVDLMREAGVQI